MQHSSSSTMLCLNHFPPLVPSLSIDVSPPLTAQSTQNGKHHTRNLLAGLSEEQRLCSAKNLEHLSCQGVLWGQTEPFPTTLQNQSVTKEFKFILEYSSYDKIAIGYAGNSSNLHSALSLSSQTRQSGIQGIFQASSTLWDVLILPCGKKKIKKSVICEII